MCLTAATVCVLTLRVQASVEVLKLTSLNLHLFYISATEVP